VVIVSFHVAIIPDGNRRWAQARGLTFSTGHEAGSKILESLMDTVLKLEIDWFTIWGSSIDNVIKRPSVEVNVLNKLYAEGLHRLGEGDFLHTYRIRVRVLGEWQNYLSTEVQTEAKAVMKVTEGYHDRSLTILLAYDGVRDMVHAINHLVYIRRQNINTVVTPQLVKASLATCDLPDVDLVIRTGGEPHLSAGFLMWEITNTQLIFLDKLWPDFTPQDLSEAVSEYHSRMRRFGA
jgi:undecaprenyl diphosphate synthase